MDHFLRKFKLTDKSNVCNTAKTLFASADMLNLLGSDKLCLPFICIELACKRCKVEIDRSLLVSSSTCSRSIYTKAFNYISSHLLQQQVNLKELAVQFDCESLLAGMEECDAAFRKEYMHAERDDSLIWKDKQSLITCGVFYACAVASKVRVDRKKLVAQSCCSDKEFGKFVEIVSKFVEVGESKRKRKAVEKEKGVKNERVKKERVREFNGINSMVSLCYEERVSDYNEWKKQILIK